MSSPSEIASFGHSGSHAPQLMHSSVIIVAIGAISLIVVSRTRRSYSGRPARRQTNVAWRARGRKPSRATGGAALEAGEDAVDAVAGTDGDDGDAEALHLAPRVGGAARLLPAEDLGGARGGRALGGRQVLEQRRGDDGE